MENLQIKVDDLSSSDIAELLALHYQRMREVSPPESCHVFNIDELRQANVTVWSAREENDLLGCIALKELNSLSGEIKSMKTSEANLRKGIGEILLNHLHGVAKRRNYKFLYLETGSMKYFEPARKLYERHGFKFCSPFSEYVEDPNSVFMSKNI